jgi:hypothetical protein
MVLKLFRLLLICAAVAGCSVVNPATSLKSNLNTMSERIYRLERQAVADCMKRRGFKFVVESGLPSLDAPKDNSGYGFASYLRYYAAHPRDSDPNEAYRQTLNSGDQLAYEEALNAGNPYGDPARPAQGATTVGCRAEAAKTSMAEKLNALLVKGDEIAARIDTDRAVLDETRLWRRCMRDKGFDPMKRDGASSFQEEYLPMVRRVQSKDPSLSAAIDSFEIFEKRYYTADGHCGRNKVEQVRETARQKLGQAVAENVRGFRDLGISL